MKPYLLLFMAVTLVVGGCKQKPPPEQPSRTPPRTDFSPEDFGIGRKHTKSTACNREIDQLLDQARVCYGSRPMAECEALQRGNSDKIGRLKNSSRCSH
jgi:hypothetical protein